MDRFRSSSNQGVLRRSLSLRASVIASRWRTGLLVVTASLAACYSIKLLPPGAALAPPSPFDGAEAGEAREIVGVRLRWCPAGVFTMGSPPDEPEQRPGEDQVQVMISKGFWAGQYEVTQGEWKRVVGAFPAEFNVGAGDDYPMYRVNFAEAEEFCRRLTSLAHAAGELPGDWEFRLPTEAQWEYAARNSEVGNDRSETVTENSTSTVGVDRSEATSTGQITSSR
jgi:formylglycine-generating enzyme required for sulfatase activity